MPYFYEWLQPARVIFCYVYGDQTVEEAIESLRVLESHLTQGTAPTHYIVDTRDNIRLPTTNIRQFRKLVSFVRHPHLGWVVAIVKSPMTSYVFSLVAKLTRARYRAVETPEEALDFLHSTDPTVTLDTDFKVLIDRIHQQTNSVK